MLASHLLGWDPIACVEWDDYCQQLLVQRMRDGSIPVVPVYGDIRAFLSEGYAERYRGVDVVSAGFPCQPFSAAGKRLGDEDPRNMWPATAGVLRVVRPRHAFLENVPGLLSAKTSFCSECGGEHAIVGKRFIVERWGQEPARVCTYCGRIVRGPADVAFDWYFGTILGDLAEIGFDVWWCVLGAGDVGAPHIRKRLWLRCELADAARNGESGSEATGTERE